MKKKTPSVSRVSFVVAPSARPTRLVSHLVHHSGVPRLSLRPIRRDLNLRLLNRRAQSRRLLCARDRIHASHVSRRARRSDRSAQSINHSFTRASPSSRTFPRRAHDGLCLLLRDHELRDPIRARRVHDDRPTHARSLALARASTSRGILGRSSLRLSVGSSHHPRHRTNAPRWRGDTLEYSGGIRALAKSKKSSTEDHREES